MGISRDNWHKRRKTGGTRKPYHKKRKHDLGHPAATLRLDLAADTVRAGRQQEGRALRLDVDNFSWGSECGTRKTRMTDVVYNAPSNKLVRTEPLVQNCIVLADSTRYRQWNESHWALPLGHTKGAKLTPEEEVFKQKTMTKYDGREKNAIISSLLEEQCQQASSLPARSRPGRCGHPEGCVPEGKDLQFYQVTKVFILKKK
uniref:Small ribosomal subunit protein eS8 n=1 Tax=Myotis lucifugus TaxID=59463 RepID=G1QDP7_MYOLU